jgi:hypothetical protein
MAIGKLLRENATLAVGIVLPILVVVFFLLATYIPRLLVDPPQHDFLFVQDNDYRAQPSRWRHEIDLDSQRKLRVRAFLTEPDTRNYYRPRLFLYEHLDGNVREISLPSPEMAEMAETTEGAKTGVVLEVPEFSDQIIDSRRVAPDGYELVEPRRRGGDFLGLFYRGGRRGLAIGKNGAVVAVPSGNDVSYYGARFLGWIVTPPDQ